MIQMLSKSKVVTHKINKSVIGMNLTDNNSDVISNSSYIRQKKVYKKDA
jgi:hypothetical protein